jgi:hypothetical protein
VSGYVEAGGCGLQGGGAAVVWGQPHLKLVVAGCGEVEERCWGDGVRGAVGNGF